MGNQQSSSGVQRRTRFRSIDQSALDNKGKGYQGRRYDDSKNNSSFSPLASKLAAGEESRKRSEQNENPDGRNYRSIDDGEPRSRTSLKKDEERDRILEALSKKNEQLRKELRQISENLTEQLKRKKMVPKKKKAGLNDEDEEAKKTSDEKVMVGLKRQLQNGYKQIEMYKKTIATLKSKQEAPTAEYKVNYLENQIAAKNTQIQKLIKKIDGIKKIKVKQDVQIEQDINDDLREGVELYKKQSEQLKSKLKELANRDRMREENYKKQQAYLCDLEKKVREMEGSYFPELNSHLKKEEQQKTVASDKEKEINNKQFMLVADEAKQLRLKHEEYNRKIEGLLQLRNKRIEEQNDLKDQVIYKDRIIQALKAKIDIVQKLLKPRRGSLFGSESNAADSRQNQSYNDNQSQIQRQLEEQLNQDQFDIKHLIANIPKPVRRKPQEMSHGGATEDNSVDGAGDRRRNGSGGMIITSQKAQPKKWGANSCRVEERGKHLIGELAFEDRSQFEGDVQPLIVGVNVWVNKNNTIQGIQAIYLNNNELRYGVKSSNSIDGIIRRFDLQTPDYLKNMNLTISKDGFVESVTLFSKQGKIGKFGNKRAEDQNVNFGLAGNQRPFLFLGASSLYEAEPRLNFFGLEICSQ